MTQCYGKALINFFFFSKFSRYDVVLFVCLVLLALCLVLRLLLSCIAGQGGELPRGVIDQSDLVLVVLNWCCWCCSDAAGAEDLGSG